MTKAWIVVLLCACGGGSSADDDASDAGAQPIDHHMLATLTYADGRVIHYDAPSSFALSAGLCSCAGESVDGVALYMSWEAARTEAPGTYPVTTTNTIIVNESSPFAKYVAASGEILLGSIDAQGALLATFSAPTMSLTSFPTGMPPDESVQLTSVTEGALDCRGRADGPYASCWN